MIHRKDLTERPLKDVVQLSDDQVEEELLMPMIENLNKYPEFNSGHAFTGDTLLVAQRDQIDTGQETIFLVCKIQRFLLAEEENPVPVQNQ